MASTGRACVGGEVGVEAGLGAGVKGQRRYQSWWKGTQGVGMGVGALAPDEVG
jgi:hypothetical protein